MMQEHHHEFAAKAPDHPRPVFNGGTPNQRATLIDRFARELERSFDEVAPVYDQIYAQMAGTATVRDFLPVLVLKKLRMHFRN